MKMKKKSPTEDDLDKFNVKSWGTWSKEVSEFDWSYGDTETCYILDGEVEVTDKLLQIPGSIITHLFCSGWYDLYNPADCTILFEKTDLVSYIVSSPSAVITS